MSQPDNVGGPSKGYLSGIERFVILTCGMPVAMTSTIMMPIMQKMQETLATGPNDAMLVRIALTVAGVSMMIGSPLAGWLIDRIGVRPLIIGAVIVWVGFGCLNFAITDLYLLIASRFVQGFAAASLVIAATTIVGKIPSEVDRGHWIGVSLMIATLSGLITLVLAGMLGDINWRYSFFLHLLYLPMLASALMLPNVQVAKRETAVQSEGFWQTFPWGLALVSFLAGTVAFTNNALMPFRYHEIGVEKSTMIGAALTAMTVSIAFSSALFGKSRQWLSAEDAFRLSFGLTTIGAIICATMSQFWVVIGGQLLFGAGAGGMVPNILAIVSATAVENRGKVTGFVKGLNYGAPLVATVALEPLMRMGGISAALLALAAISLVTGVGITIAERRRKANSLQAS